MGLTKGDHTRCLFRVFLLVFELIWFDLDLSYLWIIHHACTIFYLQLMRQLEAYWMQSQIISIFQYCIFFGILHKIHIFWWYFRTHDYLSKEIQSQDISLCKQIKDKFWWQWQVSFVIFIAPFNEVYYRNFIRILTGKIRINRWVKNKKMRLLKASYRINTIKGFTGFIQSCTNSVKKNIQTYFRPFRAFLSIFDTSNHYSGYFRPILNDFWHLNHIGSKETA